MKTLAAATLVALCAIAGGARAEHAPLWGYVDGKGVAHMATRQLDSRFSLVMGSERDDDVQSLRVPGKTDDASKLLTWLEIAPEVKAVQYLLREAARQTGVDAELLKAVIAVESGFNAKAVSPRGAVGLMQLTPDTAKRYDKGAEPGQPASRLLDPRTNIFIGARMLADLTSRYGSIDIALAAWNAGEGTVRRYGGVMPPIEETQAHVHMVLELYWALLQRSLPGKARQMRLETASASR